MTQFVKLINRKNGKPTLVNFERVEFVEPQAEGCNVYLSNRMVLVSESLEQIQTLASDHSTLVHGDHSTLVHGDHSTLVHGDPYAVLLDAEVSVASVTQGEATPVPEGEPSAKPGSKRETK